jgi:hypothetical protein
MHDGHFKLPYRIQRQLLFVADHFVNWESRVCVFDCRLDHRTYILVFFKTASGGIKLQVLGALAQVQRGISLMLTLVQVLHVPMVAVEVNDTD